MTWTYPFISRTPTDPYFPYLLPPPCPYISSTLFGAACPSPIWGIGHCLLFDASELSSGLSLEQMVGFSFGA